MLLAMSTLTPASLGIDRWLPGVCRGGEVYTPVLPLLWAPALITPGHFPGFPDPPAAGPAGSRTPTLGKQKAGAGSSAAGVGAAGVGARGRKASKAAGRLFAADSSTPR